jgi:hypothetical protein
MRKARLWLASALAASLVLAGAAVGEPDGDKGGPGKGNKAGPGKGGKGPGRGVDGRGGPGRGDGRGGPGRDGPGDRFRGFDVRGGPANVERALDELNLTGAKKEKAETIVQGYQENVRKLTDLARSDLLVKMKDVLSDGEYKTFHTALDRRPGPGDGRRGPGPGGRGRLNADAIVERIMSFDKNKDGKVTKDELPERMQRLIEMGDTNKDGALDKEEIKKLAVKLEREGFPGFDGRGGPGAGPRGFGGRGPGPGFPGPGGPAVIIDRAVDDLNLTGAKKEKAEAVVKAHHESVRKLMELPRSDMLVKMKDVLSEQEFKTFQTALERRPNPRPTGDSRTAELEKKIEQLQKELETLRRELRR